MGAMVIIGMILSVVLFVLVFAEGKSGKSIVDHFDDWCRKHLPW